MNRKLLALRVSIISCIVVLIYQLPAVLGLLDDHDRADTTSRQHVLNALHSCRTVGGTSEPNICAHQDMYLHIIDLLWSICKRSPRFQQENNAVIESLLTSNEIPAFTLAFIRNLIGRLDCKDILDERQPPTQGTGNQSTIPRQRHHASIGTQTLLEHVPMYPSRVVNKDCNISAKDEHNGHTYDLHHPNRSSMDPDHKVSTVPHVCKQCLTYY